MMDKTLGRIVNDNLADYLIPVHADMPRFDIHRLPEDEPHLGSGGVKGIGMLGICGTAAAIANALFHATGRRIRDLPIQPEKLLQGSCCRTVSGAMGATRDAARTRKRIVQARRARSSPRAASQPTRRQGMQDPAR